MSRCCALRFLLCVFVYERLSAIPQNYETTLSVLLWCFHAAFVCAWLLWPGLKYYRHLFSVFLPSRHARSLLLRSAISSTTSTKCMRFDVNLKMYCHKNKLFSLYYTFIFARWQQDDNKKVSLVIAQWEIES